MTNQLQLNVFFKSINPQFVRNILDDDTALGCVHDSLKHLKGNSYLCDGGNDANHGDNDGNATG